jgi:hypothetical protein
VAYSKRDIFWENIKRDHANGMLGCYEVRLEEIINSCTDTTRKYWKSWRNQRGIAARRKRTELFKLQIFRHRRTEKCHGYEAFGNRKGTFPKRVLCESRNRIIRSAGNQIGGLEWEETLLYAMASNGDYLVQQ